MFRRLLDMLAHRPAPPLDERTTKAKELNGLERQVRAVDARIRAIRAEAVVADRRFR